MNPISSIELANAQICPLLDCKTEQDKHFSPHTTLADGIVRLLNCYTIRSITPIIKYINNKVLMQQQAFIVNILHNIKTSLQYINRKTPITATNITKSIIIDDAIPVNLHIHYLYNRKQGPCYGIILHDTIDFSNTMLDVTNDLLTLHIMTCAATIADLETTKHRTRFIEIMYPISQTIIERRIITLDNTTNEYIKYAQASLIQAARLYYVSKEHIPNWSYKCIRCTQESRCAYIRRERNRFPKLVWDPGTRTSGTNSSCTEQDIRTEINP